MSEEPVRTALAALRTRLGNPDPTMPTRDVRASVRATAGQDSEMACDRPPVPAALLRADELSDDVCSRTATTLTTTDPTTVVQGATDLAAEIIYATPPPQPDGSPSTPPTRDGLT